MLSIMKMKQKKLNKKFIIILFAVALLIVAIFWLLINKPFAQHTTSTGSAKPANSVDYGPPTAAQQQQNQQQKQDIIDQNKNGNNPGVSTGEPQQNSSTLTATISRAGQSGPGQPVSVRILVTGTRSGTCNLTFSRSGFSDIVKTSTIVYQATTSTCSSDVPTSDFPASGDWKLVAEAVDGSSKANSQEWSVTVTK